MRNAPNWRPELNRLNSMCDALKLLGCEVGAEKDGARLMHGVACATRATVLAPTGFVYCSANGDLSFQTSSVWQIAVCSALPPTAIPTPTVRDPIIQPRLMVLHGVAAGEVPLEVAAGARFFLPSDSPRIEPESSSSSWAPARPRAFWSSSSSRIRKRSPERRWRC